MPEPGFRMVNLGLMAAWKVLQEGSRNSINKMTRKKLNQTLRKTVKEISPFFCFQLISFSLPLFPQLCLQVSIGLLWVEIEHLLIYKTFRGYESRKEGPNRCFNTVP
jgi:hypothetical protein